MEALTFFSAMNRGQFREEQGIEGSSYCIFFAPMEELVTQDRICLLYTSPSPRD